MKLSKWFPYARSTAKSTPCSRYVEVLAFVLRDMRESSKHGLCKGLWKLKERAKNVFRERSDRVIVRHANDAEETFEKKRNQDGGDLVFECAWYVDLPPNSICVIRSFPHSFVQLESDKTKLFVDRSGKSRRTDQLRPITLSISMECEGRSMVLNEEGADKAILIIS